MLGGYANKIGFVDLTTGNVEYDDAPEEWTGLASQWLLKRVITSYSIHYTKLYE